MEEIHTLILKSFDELRFNLGRKTFIDFLKGNVNPTITNNKLSELNLYGSLYKTSFNEIDEIIESLISQKYLELETIKGTIKVLKRTQKGKKEILEKKFKIENQNKKTPDIFSKETEITQQDKVIFSHFDFFLENFNDEQKKAIVSQERNILCVAGAGSGKTTVLTKRIEFLCKFLSKKQSNILAITFTRKAKEEMQLRLQNLGINEARVETFNSFCEKILKAHGDLLYSKKVEIISFSDKIKLIRAAFRTNDISPERLFYDYFTKKQIREKSSDELFFILTLDIFSIIDFYKNQHTKLKDFYEFSTGFAQKRLAQSIYSICEYVILKLKDLGLRDFSDQVPDALELFKKNKDIMPNFEYILVDEVQDLNMVQYELLDILNSKNYFYVGDPRQAIYSWRGSNVDYMLELPEKEKEFELIQLKNNYRSTDAIVEVCNKSIEKMGFVDLKAGLEVKGTKPVLQECKNEDEEFAYVSSSIKGMKSISRNEIFVLARTNRILENMAEHFKKEGIAYAIKSEEGYVNQEPKENEVILATVHSIKGMEARVVFLISVNSISFPNIVQDNDILALVKEDYSYNKDEEELRLFYVALSRAKEKLFITYTKQISSFLGHSMFDLFEIQNKRKTKTNYFEAAAGKNPLRDTLRNWRREKAESRGIPPYMIISNGAIEDIIIKVPQSKLDLESVSGLGSVKIAQYGDELLKIISG